MEDPNNANPQTQLALEQKAALCHAMKSDLDHQIGMLDAKSTYVDEMRTTDPLTDRSIKHSNLVAAHACQSLLDRLKDDTGLTPAQKDSLAEVRADKLLLSFNELNFLTSLIHFSINIESVLLEIFLSNSFLGISMKTFLRS